MELPDCIIPAAGRSRRMGRWKPSMPWRGASLVEEVADAARSAGCRVIILGGRRTLRLRRLIGKRSLVQVHRSRRWRKGMDATIRSGLKYLQSEKFFVVPADMPMVRPDDYRRLAACETGLAVRPVYDGIPGHPVLMSAAAAAIIRDSEDGIPLREILTASEVALIPWDHPGVVADLDTPEEYKKLGGSAKD